MENYKSKKSGTDRRKFLKLGLMSSVTIVAGSSLISNLSTIGDDTKTSGEKVRLLTPDGKMVEVATENINKYPEALITPAESRKGIPDRKFVMVIDLAKCKNARKCVEGCQKGHNLEYHEEFMKIQLLQNTENEEPYWFPKPCFHCDEPPCVTVCPTGATFKRDDGIVLIDNERCIGCKFCMTSCPYSAREFNWGSEPEFNDKTQPYSPETQVPRAEGTVMKCDFCPDLLRQGKLPYCAQSCPMGVIYFGDKNEDIVTNGDETVRFSQLINDRGGYRYLEYLGTKPNVYYLPPVNRQFPLERGLNHDKEILERYRNVPYIDELLNKKN
ncbi:4Fe-4S dicluster domain-containing protein [Lutibacter sp.]|uniref:4Fe-4S dicluster domain-containing protein n=1 Tax=Lutibacter sp. TaxID=1925666 RepID=UPI0025BCE937|nr:4Fe-4S dicluster domain-containing protein [Lutibacter sp.]MCF6180774.1 4Fe-4S dicluster domain-containing protein [Lutibacter sp.]